ncbi:hypothetical protein QTP88_015309 [Uroleucon formosanum]
MICGTKRISGSSETLGKRAGKEEEVEEALKQWFTKVREKDDRVTGPLLRQKAEELAKKMGKDDFVATKVAARSWINSKWPSLIAKYPPSCVFKHNYAFKNEKTRGTNTSKERLTILCCAIWMGVKNLPVDYTANSNAWMTKEIFTEWLTKWDNELRHDVLLLVDNCTAHVVAVKFKLINLVFFPLTLHQSYNRNVISVIDANLEQELSYEAWNIVSKITIRNCFRHGGFILCPKEVEAAVERPTDLSTELYNEWINIDEEVQITELVTEEDICGEIQSKRFKENVVGDSDEEEPDEKPPSTIEMLEALQILRRVIQQRAILTYSRNINLMKI